jgi:hypothetical protein
MKSGRKHLSQLQDLSRRIAGVSNACEDDGGPTDEVVELATEMLHLRNEYLDSRGNKASATGQRSVGDGGGGEEDGADDGGDGDDDEDGGEMSLVGGRLSCCLQLSSSSFLVLQISRAPELQTRRLESMESFLCCYH